MNHDLGDLIQNILQKYGISQRTVALRMNVSDSFISQVKSGKKNISIEFINKFCGIFCIDEPTRLTLIDAHLRYGKINDVSNDSAFGIYVKSRSGRASQESLELCHMLKLLDLHKFVLSIDYDDKHDLYEINTRHGVPSADIEKIANVTTDKLLNNVYINGKLYDWISQRAAIEPEPAVRRVPEPHVPYRVDRSDTPTPDLLRQLLALASATSDRLARLEARLTPHAPEVDPARKQSQCELSDSDLHRARTALDQVDTGTEQPPR